MMRGVRSKDNCYLWVRKENTYSSTYGHIKPYCYILHCYPKNPTKPKANHVMIKTRKEWKPKVVDTSLIAHTSLTA